jgi:6-pyruvoyltetrahydropterin/6-carboxytetrahydropterin synthase
MAKRYVIRISTEFSAAHVLHGYAGACNRVHGHNWTVEVEAVARELDALGMGIDFRELRQATEAITAKFDHQLINEIAPFTEVNPTAENVAAHIYRQLLHDLPDLRSERNGRVALQSVTVRENARSSVTYSEA